ncbi:hypothetical protein HWV62_6073 [Athelia sp. TMB]|nr:hypothetical protein HWV62_6073 [Athelia sp. TMB]
MNVRESSSDPPVLAVGSAIAVNIVPAYDEWQKFDSIVIAWHIANLVTNNAIAIALIYYLNDKRKTGKPFLDQIVNQILSGRFPISFAHTFLSLCRWHRIPVTLATGALTSLMNLGSLVLFVLKGPSVIFDMPMCALYTSSVLAMLDSGYQFPDRTPTDCRTEGDVQFTTALINEDGAVELQLVGLEQ